MKEIKLCGGSNCCPILRLDTNGVRLSDTEQPGHILYMSKPQFAEIVNRAKGGEFDEFIHSNGT